ncbi:MAG TPA: hypothetical protein VK171_07560, partial [Fimbriimonas sp.]|nr:hypothetical protein [Fimbriimonas sp.]
MSKYIPTPSRQGKPNSAKASTGGKTKFKKGAHASDARTSSEQRPQQDGYQRPTRNTTSPRATEAPTEASPKRDKTSKFESRISREGKPSRFGKREDRGSATRGPSDNTRPQPPRADSRPTFRQDRPISNDVPRVEAPRSTYAERKYGNRDNSAPQQRDARPYNDRARNDRPYNDRPQGDRPYNDRPQGDRPQYNRSNDRPYNNRPYNDRPQGDRP